MNSYVYNALASNVHRMWKYICNCCSYYCWQEPLSCFAQKQTQNSLWLLPLSELARVLGSLQLARFSYRPSKWDYHLPYLQCWCIVLVTSPCLLCITFLLYRGIVLEHQHGAWWGDPACVLLYITSWVSKSFLCLCNMYVLDSMTDCWYYGCCQNAR